MKKIKNIFVIILLISLTIQVSMGQSENLQWLDIELSNYKYPFPVKTLDLNIQEQDLKMAYMDVVPENYSGKNVVLFHGKILMVHIGQRQLKP